jgi:hypothetical protein
MRSNAEASGPSSTSATSSTSPESPAALTEVGEKSAPGTLGLATITMNVPLRSRPMRFAVLGAVAGMAIGVAGVLLMVRGGGTGPAVSASPSVAASNEPAGSAATAPASSEVENPGAAPSASAAAAAASSPAAAAASSTPASAPPRPRAAPRTPPPKHRVNYGF